MVVNVVVPPSFGPNPTLIRMADQIATAIGRKTTSKLLSRSREIEKLKSPSIVVGELNSELRFTAKILKTNVKMFYIACTGEPTDSLDPLQKSIIIVPNEYTGRKLLKHGLKIKAKFPPSAGPTYTCKRRKQNSFGYVNPWSIHNYPKHAIMLLRNPYIDFTAISDRYNRYARMVLMNQNLPYLSQEELNSFYDGIGFYLDIAEADGFGLYVLQAMARGCVPIVPDRPPLDELIPRELRITIPICGVNRVNEGWLVSEYYEYSRPDLEKAVGRALSLKEDEYLRLSNLCMEHVKKLCKDSYLRFLDYLEYKEVKSLDFFCPCLDPSGYGEASRSYLLGLMKLGWQLYIHRLHFTGNWYAPLDIEVLDLFHRYEVSDDMIQGDLVLLFTTPNYWYRYHKDTNHVGLTLFECDRIHPSWVMKMNDMDGIITTSKFCRDVFKLCGVKKKIDVVPIGIDTSIFYPPTKEYKESESSELKFIAVGQYTSRKGFDLLLKAWLEAFKDVQDVSLTLYTFRSNVSEPEFKAIEKDIDTIIKGRSTPKVTLKRPYCHQRGYAEILRQHHVFILPSRGEGFCIPAVEAQACGLLPIVTNGSSLPEVIAPDCGRLIKVDGLETCWGLPHIPWYNKTFDYDPRWLKPNLQDIIHHLKWCYENRDEAIAKGLEASNYVRERFDMMRVTKQLERVLLYYTD